MALAITIVAWIVSCFDLAGHGIKIFHTPLWVIGSTLNTWTCAIVVSTVLSHTFFTDFSLDDEEAKRRTTRYGETKRQRRRHGER